VERSENQRGVRGRVRVRGGEEGSGVRVRSGEAREKMVLRIRGSHLLHSQAATLSLIFRDLTILCVNILAPETLPLDMLVFSTTLTLLDRICLHSRGWPNAGKIQLLLHQPFLLLLLLQFQGFIS